MTLNDAAQILGIPINATEKQLISAFRKLAKQYHPDTHPNDRHAVEMMAKINEAYNVFKKHLENGGASHQGNASGTRPNPETNTGRPNTSGNTGNARPDYDDHRPRNERYDATMAAIIKDLWEKYQAADKKYREYGPELNKAFNEKKRQQERMEKQREIWNNNPTTENFQAFSNVMMDYNRALMNHNTAKFTMQTLKFERDLWHREYSQRLAEYNNYKQQGRK